MVEQRQNESESRGLSCDNCNFIGQNKAGLSKHNQTKHGKKKKSDKEINRKMMLRKMNLQILLKLLNYLRNSESDYSCTTCNADFAPEEAWKNPMRATHKN